MKVLLVYPEFPDTYWSFRHALKFEGKQAAFPPLGLLTVSAMLPKDWERRLVDMNVETLWPDVTPTSQPYVIELHEGRRILELPRSMNPVCIIPIGWPRGRYGPTTRRPIGEVVHLDRYGNRPFLEDRHTSEQVSRDHVPNEDVSREHT